MCKYGLANPIARIHDGMECLNGFHTLTIRNPRLHIHLLVKWQPNHFTQITKLKKQHFSH